MGGRGLTTGAGPTRAFVCSHKGRTDMKKPSAKSLLSEPSTILSDDEVDEEVDEDEELLEVSKTANNKAGNKKKLSKAKASKGFAIDFDEGELYPQISVKNAHSPPSDDEDDEDEDLPVDENKIDKVRTMERVEKRIEREKKKKANTKGSTNNTQPSKEVAEGGDDDDEDDDAADAGMSDAQEKAYFDQVIDATKKTRTQRLAAASSSSRATGKAAVAEADEQDRIQFSQLNLSRPLLRAIESLGYVEPTPIQAQVVPLALAGRDICASAVTGSGKTAAFALPFLERLLYRPKDIPAIRVLVITPTRELATQIHEVVVKLSQFTDISSCVICGGKKDVKSQESTLRAQPDVVICTPGRMLDHLRNSRSVSIDDLDVLILDEVDRLLELGFQEEVEELVKYCPTARQTMLFSATMTPKVDDLAKLSLKKPIRVKTEKSNATVASRLVQEFVKVRESNDVEAMLLSLVCRSFQSKTIVFFELKRAAHRFTAILKLLGVKASELHGDLPQTQRYLSLREFSAGETDVLVATDVAARGIDIPHVETVINAEMPRNVSNYVHRVGRTARAGKCGTSVTLVTDDRRKIMKDVLKEEAEKMQEGNRILSRTIPSGVITEYRLKINQHEDAIATFLEEERARMRLENLTRDTEKAENLLTYADEIQSRPARTWFQSQAAKQETKELVRQQVREERERAKESRVLAPPANADEAQSRQLMSDDYRLDDKDNAKLLKHRMSRMKRRRQEALAAEAEDNAARQEHGEKVMNVDRVGKAMKTTQRKREEERREKSAGEIAMKKVTVVDVPHGGDDDADGSLPQRKRVKIVRQKFAVGGFDGDANEWMGGAGLNRINKKKMRQEARESEFTEFDPEKRLRKGGKKSNQSFKSKSKHRRRR